ncbi:hypothetical protein [Mesobacterium pallidum]|uniref:hypothetical protein n=1 Tax=Mesobacterium pallidum TaxID=2872037 RepID=UPI001EE1C8D0|nr:hypothetical protein [Mesobacterium pallidum]
MTILTEDLRLTATFSGYGFGNQITFSHDGGLMVIGAGPHAYPDIPGTAQGAVYIYDTSDFSAPLAVLQPTLLADDYFGYSVSLSADGSLLLVSAPGDDHDREEDPSVFDPSYINDTGMVYVYDLSGTAPLLAGTMQAPDGLTGYDRFGEEIVLSADGTRAMIMAVQPTAVGGAAQVHVYDFSGSTPTFLYTIDTAPAGNPAGGGFGRGMVLSADGTLAAISAPFEMSGTSQGAIYLYDLSGAAPAFVARIAEPATGVRASFGEHMALSADGTVLVASADDVGTAGLFDATRGGSVHVYDLDETGAPTLRMSFTAGDNDVLDQFGQDIALTADGKTLYVGAPGWDGPDLNTTTGDDVNDGAIYVYDISGDAPVLMLMQLESDDPRIPYMGWDIGASGDGSISAGAWNRTPPLDQQVDIYRTEFLTWDRRVGTDGEDELTGSAGSQAMFGASGRDLMSGRAGDDWIDGGRGGDTLRGGAGDDVLIDGFGQDRMIGGAGADTFVLERDGQVDRVIDFETGIDTLDLRSWGATGFADLAVTDLGSATRIAFEDEILLLRGDAPLDSDILFS